MRKHLLFPLGIGFALVAAGLLLLNGSIVAAAIPLLLFVSVRMLSSPRSAASDLLLERSAAQLRATEGDEIDVELTVTNPGPASTLLAVTDGPPVGLTPIAGHVQFLGRLPARATEAISYTVLAYRGLHTFGETQIRVWSPWGLAMHESRVRLDTNIKVHPRAERLDPITIRPQRTRAFAGPVKANRGGQGLDFFGCRAYTPGDDVRRINWRAYARQDSLTVNEYELERIADVNIILDARAKSHSQLDDETTFDHSVRAAASLASHFLEQGNNVGLLIYGDYVQWAFPGIGRLQRERILDELAEARLGDKAVFEELRFIPTRLFPARSQLVLVSPLIDEDDVEIVALLVERGYSVLVVCPHSLTLAEEERLLEDDAAVDLARRVLGLKRELFLGGLAGIGASVIDWRVDEPLRVACQRIHHSRVRRYRI
jgi:uncharacterized protein (DUF58 family)